MKKTIFALALLIGFAFSISSYAGQQDQSSTTKTETVKQEDTKKSDASGTEVKKDEAGCKKECTKKSDKSSCNKDTKESK